MAFDFSPYAVAGATRPDSFTGLQPDFSTALAAMFGAAPPEIQQQLRIMSGYRSPERQAQLWANALQKYGSPAAARRWVAPPGRSQHNHGNAVDLRYLNNAARQWAHQNAGQFGLAFPLSNEDWHIELASARGGGATPAAHAHEQPGPTIAAAAAMGQQQPAAQLPKMFAKAPMAEPSFGALALSHLANAENRRRQQEDEQAAEQARKNALFGGVARFYG